MSAGGQPSDPCHNGIQDGYESDVDCGGIECGKCNAGQRCRLDFECGGSAVSCDYFEPWTCVVNHCLDHHQDGDETGFDCGGSCKKCELGGCKQDSDCASNQCNHQGAVHWCTPTADKCQANPELCSGDGCTNGLRDSYETDVDCGGTNGCARCHVGQRCRWPGDCEPGHNCQYVNGSTEYVCL